VEKDRYLAQMSEVALMLGARHVPSSVTAVRTYLRDVQGDLLVTPEALEALHFLRTPFGGGAAEALAHRVVTAAAIDQLPEFARRALGLGRQTPVGRAQARTAAATFAVLLRWAVGPSEVLATATDRALAG